MDNSEDNDMQARMYQTQLEEIAVKQNTIINLPTGSGKTFIAIRLIKRFRADLREPWGNGGKRTFFLVNTVPLVTQQKKVIQTSCPVHGVAGYSSEDRVDYWDKKKWDSELAVHQVIVMTSQILCDMLTHQYIKIEDINLLIFDECHHAVDDHPMRLIMKHFADYPVQKQPRVLGLTATLLNANVVLDRVESALEDLEKTFHATIATVNELGEVLSYSTNPHEFVQFYQSPIITNAAKEAIQILEILKQNVEKVHLPRVTGTPNIELKMGQKDITTDPDKIVKIIKNMIFSMINFIEDMGLYSGALGILAYVIQFERLKRRALSKEETLLYTVVITHSLKARMILLKSMENETGYKKILKYSSEHIIQLLNILKEYNPATMNSGATLKVNIERKELSAIIFTKQRFTAKILYNFLNDVTKANPEEFSFLKHDYVTGFNVNPFNNTREQYFTKKASEKVLFKFRNKQLNCLISTSVVEEGVDIPQCTLVVRYDPPLEYRSYVQSKGRARSTYASYVMLINQNEREKFMAKYNGFQRTEKYIQLLLVGNTDDRDAPTQKDIQRELYEEDEIPPYITEYGSRLSSVSAISLLNRYCSTLPHDQFTVISPMWILEKVPTKNMDSLIRISITLPLQCPIKEDIKGGEFKNLKTAKRSAALNACIRLHQEEELDPMTLLPKKYAKVDFDCPDVKQCFPNWPLDENEDAYITKPGTKKRVRKHGKVFPSCLNGPGNFKFGLQKFYLHIFKLSTNFEEPKESREKALYDLLQRGECFGFITAQPLPKICDFPMFLTVGEVTTSILINYAVMKLKVDQFELIKQFHYFLFDQVLEVAKKFVVFDGKVNAMYVVPIKAKNGYDIDWDVMVTYKEIPPVVIPSHEERRALEVERSNYRYHVVTPWYRGLILPDRYMVSDVLEYMTPQSRFDNDSYDSFEEYYMQKYNLEVVGRKDQPLLEVRNISTRMNCLMPRAATIKSLTEKQRKLISVSQDDEKPNSFPEVFVPEFCVKYEFPGVLWYKAMLLPSIIHRVYMLLVAEELRSEIARGTNYGPIELLTGEKWEPIQVDLEVAIKSLLPHIEVPPAINTVDRINDPADENAPPKLNIMSMKESLYQIQNKKTSKDYPWEDNMEPIDIERNVSIVTLMDIECYDKFVSAPVGTSSTVETVAPRLPPQANQAAAILPPPLKYNDQIDLLTKKPTGRGPELSDVLAALTTINSSDNFNLERAETLGDSFLKFAASLYLFHKFPGLNEGQLTNIKCRLIGNRNLYYAGEKVRLGGRMKVEVFSPRKDFMLPGFFSPKQVQDFMAEMEIRPTFLIGVQFSASEALSGQITDESWSMVQKRYSEYCGAAEREPPDSVQTSMQSYVRAQAVSDKSVADCVEALIGTYLLSGGILGAVKFIEWMNILPPQDNFAEFLNRKVPTVLTEKKTTEENINFFLIESRTDVENILQYKFKDPSFLLEALSHPSYIRNRLTRSYERLEFLGDAILDFLITSHIFQNCRKFKPGELTDLRSALVNNVTFASYVVKLGLHKHICSQLNPVLEGAIIAYVEHQEQRNHEIVEDVLYLIDEEDSQIAEYVEVPKVLSDIFESLTGAIFLDSGGDIQSVWRVIYPIMCREIDAFSARIPQQPVRVLYEMVHACPVFEPPRVVEESEVPRVMVSVRVTTRDGRQRTANGFGANKFQAKRAAAKLALKILNV